MKARIQDKPQLMFKFSDKASLVSLSHHKAVGELLGQVSVQSFLAKSMYVSLYIDCIKPLFMAILMPVF